MTYLHRLIVMLAVCAPLIVRGADPLGNLPMPPGQLQHRLLYDDFTIRSAKGAGGGVMGAKKLELQFAEEPTLVEAKWKATSSSGDSWNNSPRREIGVYAMQAYFLDESEYLVPPTAARCISLATYRVVDAETRPTFEGTSCVFGALSAWLRNVEQPHPVFDRARDSKDSLYAVRFGDLNLLHYLVDHRDSRANNFLMSTDPSDPRLFSVDNGIAFGGVLYNFFTWHFNQIHAPLPRAAIDRLRTVSRQDLNRLGVLAQLEIANGVLRNVPLGINIDTEKGMRWAGRTLQFGLTRAEIDAVADRLRTLLADVDAGELRVF